MVSRNSEKIFHRFDLSFSGKKTTPLNHRRCGFSVRNEPVVCTSCARAFAHNDSPVCSSDNRLPGSAEDAEQP
jgi:hypothetical protein